MVEDGQVLAEIEATVLRRAHQGPRSPWMPGTDRPRGHRTPAPVRVYPAPVRVYDERIVNER